MRIREVDRRDLRRHGGQIHVEQRQFRRVGGLQMADDARHNLRQHRHDIQMVADEAHLQIEADVLVDVADGVVRLGAEDRADLVDALEDADHDLLVELRALRQIGLPLEVLHGEDVRAALGRRGDQLRGLDFGEPQAVQRRPVAGHDARRQTEQRALLRMAQTDDRVIEEDRQARLQHRLVQADGRGLAYGREHFDDRRAHFHPAGRLRLGNHGALDGQHRLRQQPVEHGQRLGRVNHDLRGACARRAAPES